MAEDEFRIAVDGETYSLDALTFKERREARRIAREIADDPDATPDEEDYLIGIITVCKRRTTPGFTVDAAMELTPNDIEVPPDPPKRATARAKKTPSK